VRCELLEFGLFGLCLQAGNRFADKIIRHRDALAEQTTTIESKLSFTGRFRIAGFSPQPRCCGHALSLRKKAVGRVGYCVAVFFT
jgi:hypothetical protein